MNINPADIERLIEWTTRLRHDQAAMPWAEPPPQPDAFDVRDAAEADDFAARWATPLSPVTANLHLFPLRRCDRCGYRVNAPGHRSVCETP